jgi:hypothetical protein
MAEGEWWMGDGSAVSCVDCNQEEPYPTEEGGRTQPLGKTYILHGSGLSGVDSADKTAGAFVGSAVRTMTLETG